MDGQKAHEKMSTLLVTRKRKSRLQWDIHTSQKGHHQNMHKQENAGEGVERREASYTVGSNVSWYSHCAEQCGGSLKANNRGTIWPCNPTPGQTEKNMIQKDICTPMFIAALFTIAKTCKQPKCPSTDEWIKKMWNITQPLKRMK